MVTLFIKDAIIGDVVEAKVMKVKKNYGYARMMNILTPSPYRVKQPKCDGPQMRRLPDPGDGVRPPAGLQRRQDPGKPYAYRRSAGRSAGSGDGADRRHGQPISLPKQGAISHRNGQRGHIITGFYAGRTHSIIPNTDCALGVEVNEIILKQILAFMEEYKISAYDEDRA